MDRPIAFFLFPEFQLLDLSGPLAAFQTAAQVSPDLGYRFVYPGTAGGRVASTVGLDVAVEPVEGRIDTLVVVGGRGARRLASDPWVLAQVTALAGRTRRVTSVCTGSFLLAGTGLLDGLGATTHWRHAGEFQARFPAVRVEPDRIWVREGRFWTSAGITAGIDLALALIEEDGGPEVAREVARELVVHHRRPGGQSQFSGLQDIGAGSDRMALVLSWVRDHLAEPLTVERLAEVACLGPRQFSRAFRAETGQTPAKVVERLRVEVARAEVEAGSLPLEEVARRVGFDDPERLRRAFLRWFGEPPQALRRRARSRP